MPEERICHICGRANPLDQPRCINCGQRASGTVVVAETKDSASSYTSPWWTASTTGAIPPPPQVVEEVQRAERARLDEERRRVEAEKRRAEVCEFEARAKARESSVTAQQRTPAAGSILDSCPRCGSNLEHPSDGRGFSLCLRCGADVPQETRKTVGRAAYESTTSGSTTQTVRGGVTVATTSGQGSTISPVLPTFLSFLLPGVGQIINGQFGKGVLLLLACYAALNVFGIPAFSFFALVGRVIAAVDANRIAARRRAGTEVRDGEWDLG